jgi:hypothetical protein
MAYQVVDQVLDMHLKAKLGSSKARISFLETPCLLDVFE